jgi:hypothetical protein
MVTATTQSNVSHPPIHPLVVESDDEQSAPASLNFTDRGTAFLSQNFRTGILQMIFRKNISN